MRWLIVHVLVVLVFTAPVFAVHYDLWNDWTSYNPSGPWIYGRFVDGPGGEFKVSYWRWANPDSDGITIPKVFFHNRPEWDAITRYYGTTYDEQNWNPPVYHGGWCQHGEIRITPGDGPVGSADWGVIRWKAPAAGSAVVSIGIYARNNWGHCSVDAQVQVNRGKVAQAAIRGFDGSPNMARTPVSGYATRLVYSKTLTLDAGDTIDVALGNQNGSNGWDDTTVIWSVDFTPAVPVPEPAPAPPAPEWDVMSDTWVGTDDLGRNLPDYTQCRAPQANRTVGITYEPWHCEESGAADYGPSDMSQIFAEAARRGPYTLEQILTNEAVLQQVMGDPTLPWSPLNCSNWWAKPELGYYVTRDEYVIRKHAQLLTDAGVDVIFVDLTNTIDYQATVHNLIKVFRQIRSEGGRTPQISFFVHWFSAQWLPVVYKLYIEPEPDSELWFKWQGKPLVLADPEGVNSTILNAVTVRDCWGTLITEPNHWGLVGFYPQPVAYTISPVNGAHVPEAVTVSVAQGGEGTYGNVELARTNFGRNFHDGIKPPYSQWDYTGRNYAEQWRRALEVDPPFVFQFVWNEWVSTKYEDPPGHYVLTGSLCEEYNADIEPMEGGYGDLYYYQMMSNIRRYKGVRRPETASGARPVAIDGDFSDWNNVFPEYRDNIGDTAHRDHDGWGFVDANPSNPRLHYTNFTGRNDLVRMKVARNASYIYFYAETRDPITHYTDPNWMLLFIDSDSNNSTGWHGYDYLVNNPVINSNTTTLKRYSYGSWVNVSSISYAVNGNKLEIRIPRADIGETDTNVALDFHWADNIQSLDSIKEFNINGDSAPNRICRYRYNTAVGFADTTPPAGSVWINSGSELTHSTSVNLLLSAIDSGSIINAMRFSNDNATWSTWEAYSTNKVWMLSSGSGTKTVYAQFRDAAGNVSPSCKDTIELDITIPTGTISINNGALYTGTPEVTLYLTATDASGVSQMRFSNNNALWTLPEPFTQTKPWTLSTGYDMKNVYVKYIYTAGNVSASIVDSIRLVAHADISIAEAKALADGESAGLKRKTVSAVFTDGFYIFDSDRSAGIFVQAAEMPAGLAVGGTVEVAGIMRTNPAGERYIAGEARVMDP